MTDQLRQTLVGLQDIATESARVAAVSMVAPTTYQKLTRKAKVEYPLLSDPGRQWLAGLGAAPDGSVSVLLVDAPSSVILKRWDGRGKVPQTLSEIGAAVAKCRAALGSEVMEQLAALGSIGSEGGVGDEKTAMLDAKDQGPLINKLDRARLLGARGKPKEAIALYREIIAEQPQIAEARMGLARLLSQTRQHDEAEATLPLKADRDNAPHSTSAPSDRATSRYSRLVARCPSEIMGPISVDSKAGSPTDSLAVRSTRRATTSS
jgi:tetratricopeptide (TPR) repeat protein